MFCTREDSKCSRATDNQPSHLGNHDFKQSEGKDDLQPARGQKKKSSLAMRMRLKKTKPPVS